MRFFHLLQKYDWRHVIDSLLVVPQLDDDTAQHVSLCWRACGSSFRRLRYKYGHILNRRIPAALFWGWLVALLIFAHTLRHCHINMLLFKCCQPVVANCTFFSVPGQFFKSVEREPAFT